MLKIKDNVSLEQLKKFGLEPIYDCDSRTGDVYIRCIVSNKYSGKYGNLTLSPKKKGLHILKNIISNYNRHISFYKFDEDTYVDIDLLYDLIKADIVEKIKD